MKRITTILLIVSMGIALIASCEGDLHNLLTADVYWIPNSAVQATMEDLGPSSVDLQGGYEVELVIENALWPGETELALGGQILGKIENGAATYYDTGDMWATSRDNLTFTLSGGTATYTFAVKPSSGFENWNRGSWVTADVDVAFTVFAAGTWDRKIGCWDDANEGKDGNFFLDFGDIPTGHKVRITMNCALAQDL